MDQKEISEKIPTQELRRALEELRDTRNDRRAQELKKVITDQICEVTESERPKT